MLKKIIISIILSSLLGFVFYRSIVASIILSSIIFLYILRMKKDDSDIIRLSFKEFLNSVHSEILVGQSFRNAVYNAIEFNDFKSEKFTDEINKLYKSLSLGIEEKKAFEEFRAAFNDKYINEFVSILNITYLYSGNIVEIIELAVDSISNAIDLELEISIILANKKFEFYLMIIIPIVILLFLSIIEYEYVKILYTTLLGRISMTIGLLLMIISYFIGKKIINIKV